MATGELKIGRVAIVDDDPSVRVALDSLLRSLDFEVLVYASAEDFLGAPNADPSCLIVDLRLPGMSGLELQRDLVAGGRRLPTIFITAAASGPVRRAALDGGALAFLSKPVTDTALVDAVRGAFTARGAAGGD
jgi:FixJ family two-component response regulator